MFYKKNDSKELDKNLFINPTAEYRGTPFWAWNTELHIDELKRQIEIFKKMGFGGFHMHVRTGMSTPYLSDEFMSLIKGCVNKAENENMLAYLYDEDRWPSGAAGGLVTKDEKYRGRSLLMTTVPCEANNNYKKKRDSFANGDRDGNGYLITCFDIVLDTEGRLISYNKISQDDEAKGTKWYAYLKIHSDSAWYNNQAYVDTLNKEAIDKFIEVTHERYKEILGDKFDKSVPSIFTDEPQFSRKTTLDSSFDKSDCTLPWTDDSPLTFKEKYGFDIIDHIPELIWELPKGKLSKARYYYHDHVSDRFTEAFADNIGKWCNENNIYLTGHMMEEPTLRSQTCALGETMRSYRSFGIPGIDMLCANFEFTTAKQCQSAVHQYGREGMLSELYGVTGWSFDFRGHKLHGDWQECLGVTVRVPHLSWVAMGGEAKRDYPASISYQSPWWSEYSAIEDHFARVNTLMTRGKPIVKVGVIHPIESYWLHFGPDDLTEKVRDEKDKKFLDLTSWLLKGSVDFDFISESLLPSLCSVGSVPFKVGKMEYDVIVVPECESLRATTIDRLEQFKILGGKLIFMGKMPSVSDGEYSNRAESLYNNSNVVAYEKDAILNALEDNRTIKIEDENGNLTEDFIYQLRKDTDGLNLFVSHCTEPKDKNSTVKSKIRIKVQGTFSPVLYDTQTGNINDIPCLYSDNSTIIEAELYSYDSLLLKLKPGKFTAISKTVNSKKYSHYEIPDKVLYELSEDNVLLIDMCEYALDEEDFNSSEEILRLDNICRTKLGWEDRGGSVPQPWSVPREKMEHYITLRYTFNSEIYVIGAKLGLENMEDAQILFNGTSVSNIPTGWWTDKDVKTVELPAINPGANTLLVRLPFGHTSNTEWMYILGNFGVKLQNNRSVITNLPDKISFSAITKQGMPFYGGNITYNIPFECKNEAKFTVKNYFGGLVTINIDGERIGRIIYPPYEITADNLSSGKHIANITLFGNRDNCFGPVHRTIQNGWISPDAWRTEGDKWSYDYQLKEIGILEKPEIEII